MLIKDLEDVIKEENLKGANICNTTSLKPDEVVITQEDGKWKVYNTDERASLRGVVCYFDSEDEACEDFIKKLRLRKRLVELEKVIREKRTRKLQNIIVYGSQYGTAKKYADELANRLGFGLNSYESVEDINSYKTIIYVGALYAGGVLGMKKTFKSLKDCRRHKIIIATVGLADPTDKTNTDSIKKKMKKQLPVDVFDKAKIFHLRGGIDYSKLRFKHKAMMGMLYKKARTLPEDRKTAEVKAMIETYNKQVDFVDFSCLEAIIEACIER